MQLAGSVREEFDVRVAASFRMDAFIDRCANIYRGGPAWLDEDQGIRTVNFAKSVCSEAARLTTLSVGITIDGSARAAWLQQQVDRVYFRLRHWVEYGCAYGTVILKPNGAGIDLVTPERFLVTDNDGDEITGIVFEDRAYDGKKGKYFTRLEYHRFEDGQYLVSNRCFIGDSLRDKGRPVAIEQTPWAALTEDMIAEGVEQPLFGVLRMPGANNIDVDSPLGMPFFADAIEELQDLDTAYSRFAEEIYDSRRLSLLDDRLTDQAGSPVNAPRRVRLPRFVKKVFGSGKEEYYQEIDPALNTEARLKGVNALLSQIGFKCGFSNGYFVFNERGGLMTATQVEADDRRTIQLIKDLRDKLESALNGLIYALDKFADGYGLAPAGPYAVSYDFEDITHNQEEDRARWYSYVINGRIPFDYFLETFEGLSPEQAQELASRGAAASPTAAPPFGSNSGNMLNNEE